MTAWHTLLYATAAFLVGGGVGLALALFWVGRAARRRVLDELLALREHLQHDPLAALQTSGEVLCRLGVAGLGWEGQWYGAAVRGQVGRVLAAREAGGLIHSFTQPDVQLVLRVSLRGLRGEARLMAAQAAQMFFAIFEGALAARELALVSAMAQRARMAVFVQHDLRNLTQWVELMTDMLLSARTDDELLHEATRIREGARAARERAQRIAAAVLSPAAATAEAESALDLATELADVAALHQVELELSGDVAGPPVCWSERAWSTVLDNVLGNVSRLAREALRPARCQVRVRRAADGVELRFATPQLPLTVPVERVFEPWSGAAPTGNRLGLYQARRAAVAAGGELRAESDGHSLIVVLSMKCKKI